LAALEEEAKSFSDMIVKNGQVVFIGVQQENRMLAKKRT
jgi:predicted amidohydrolase YtcJ